MNEEKTPVKGKLNEKFIPEIEAYRFYKWVCDSKVVSFSEFKQNLIKNGYIIYSHESEGKINNKKDKDTIFIDTISEYDSEGKENKT